MNSRVIVYNYQLKINVHNIIIDTYYIDLLSVVTITIYDTTHDRQNNIIIH